MGFVGNVGDTPTSAEYIADELCLSVRRVRDLIDVLADYGLLVKRIDPGHPNRYAPKPDKFIELTKDITFKYREKAKGQKFYREHGISREQQADLNWVFLPNAAKR